MAFHPEKCNVPAITKKRNPIKFKRSSRNYNTLAFSMPSCRTSIRKESFYPSTTKDWNALKSVGAPSLEAFKACLRQYAANDVFNLTVNIPHTNFVVYYMRTPKVAE